MQCVAPTGTPSVRRVERVVRRSKTTFIKHICVIFLCVIISREPSDERVNGI